jgi:hypothetical protein
MRSLCALILLLAVACKDDSSSTEADKPASDEPKPVEVKKPEADKKPELLAEATQRRLHVDRAEASSFLWNDWNRFQENYHPLYLVDDDPKTAWVEGADGPGTGQWVRLHVTPVDEATAVVLELRNGYHKSRSLHQKNARAKKLTVKLLPSGVTESFELADSMEVATLELSQPAGELEAVELAVDEVYEGSKYADLCLSDVELHVTARTPENPAFEKAKLDKVRAWKKDRLEAARLFASGEGKAMPVGTSYRVVGAKKAGKIGGGHGDSTARAAALVEAAIGSIGDRPVLERAKSALASKFDGWKPVSAAVKKGRRVPAIDGLHIPEPEEMMGPFVRDDSYTLPLPGLVEFLTSSRISLFEASASTTVADALAGKPAACKRETEKPTYFYFQPPERGGVTTELLIVQCGMFAERDGYYGYTSMQLVEYDDTGKLAAVIDAASVSAFTWSAGSKLGAGERIHASYSGEITSDKLIARH